MTDEAGRTGRPVQRQERSEGGDLCVRLAVATTLKPEYAEVLQAIEVGGTPGGGERTIAKQSCGACAEHGCLNCTCRIH